MNLQWVLQLHQDCLSQPSFPSSSSSFCPFFVVPRTFEESSPIWMLHLRMSPPKPLVICPLIRNGLKRRCFLVRLRAVLVYGADFNTTVRRADKTLGFQNPRFQSTEWMWPWQWTVRKWYRRPWGFEEQNPRRLAVTVLFPDIQLCWGSVLEISKSKEICLCAAYILLTPKVISNCDNNLTPGLRGHGFECWAC